MALLLAYLPYLLTEGRSRALRAGGMPGGSHR